MKKIVSVLFAVLIVAFATIPAFAAENSVVSPVATTAPAITVETGTVNRDVSPTSPKTGTNDVLPYAVIMLSIAACGASVVMLVRTNKSK